MLTPLFLDSGPGRIFCTAIRPETPRADAPILLFLPPFAEEMNKSRHVMARLGHRLAGAGVTTLLPDLHGTGDSDGDFADADWDVWRANVVDCVEWATANGYKRLFLGGVRLGASLAVAVADDLPESPSALLLWQPLASGQAAMRQFLRVRAAATLAAGQDRETVATLRQRLAAGQSVEIAGYTLSSTLFRAVDALDLAQQPPPDALPVHWFEVALGANGEVLPAARELAAAWTANGCPVEPVAIGGEPFWAAQDRVDAPDLVEASIAALTNPRG